ncbi:MAG TPA: hypothetical protein VNS61_12630, partial [Caldimonas sp.]|nr:hypothetical protein [Caldimonas sp.]
NSKDVVDNATNYLRSLGGMTLANGSGQASDYQLPSLASRSAYNIVTITGAPSEVRSAVTTVLTTLTCGYGPSAEELLCDLGNTKPLSRVASFYARRESGAIDEPEQILGNRDLQGRFTPRALRQSGLVRIQDEGMLLPK